MEETQKLSRYYYSKCVTWFKYEEHSKNVHVLEALSPDGGAIKRDWDKKMLTS